MILVVSCRLVTRLASLWLSRMDDLYWPRSICSSACLQPLLPAFFLCPIQGPWLFKTPRASFVFSPSKHVPCQADLKRLFGTIWKQHIQPPGTALQRRVCREPQGKSSAARFQGNIWKREATHRDPGAGRGPPFCTDLGREQKFRAGPWTKPVSVPSRERNPALRDWAPPTGWSIIATRGCFPSLPSVKPTFLASPHPTLYP